MAADAVLARPRGLAAAIAPLTMGHLGTDLTQGALPVAIAPNYPAAIGCMIISGVGVAAYHPEAAEHAAWIAHDRPSTAMSLFSIGDSEPAAARDRRRRRREAGSAATSTPAW